MDTSYDYARWKTGDAADIRAHIAGNYSGAIVSKRSNRSKDSKGLCRPKKRGRGL